MKLHTYIKFALFAVTMASGAAAQEEQLSEGRMDVLDVATGKPATKLEKGHSLKIQIKTVDGKPLRAMCPKQTTRFSLKVEVAGWAGQMKEREHEIYLRDENNDANGAGDKAVVSLNFWNDPASDIKEDSVSDEFRRYLFSWFEKPKLHQIKVNSYISCVTPNHFQNRTIQFAEQDVKLDLTGDGLAEYQSLLTAQKNKAAANNRMAKPAMRSAVLERQMLVLLKKKGFEVRRVVLTDKAWNIRRNSLGAIIARSIHAQVAYKTTSGGFKVGEAAFEQQRVGGGYGATTYAGWGTGEFDILEENIKK